MHVPVATPTAVETTGWYAVWTRSHCEQLVSDQLEGQGLEVFLPKIVGWKRRAGKRRLTEQALFPGYLFVHHHMDKTTHAGILKARGVVRLLGDRWDRLTVVPDDELIAVQRIVSSGTPAFRSVVPNDGDRVRIISGPLRGLEGGFIRARPEKGIFVVSVTLLQRSVAVEVDAALVEAT